MRDRLCKNVKNAFKNSKRKTKFAVLFVSFH